MRRVLRSNWDNCISMVVLLRIMVLIQFSRESRIKPLLQGPVSGHCLVADHETLLDVVPVFQFVDRSRSKVCNINPAFAIGVKKMLSR